MDLESFLSLEKRRLAEERQRLYEQTQELNSFRTASSSDTTTPSTSMTQNNKNIPLLQSNNNDGENVLLSKKTKDWINKQYNNNKETDEEDKVANTRPVRNARRKKNQDDMEQWVSDTFYSYFPGFSNEYQKRQSELQKRQRENQENLIKHQMLNNAAQRKKKNFTMETTHVNSARSNNSSLTSNGANSSSLQGAAKTELEIINVNNPNYVPSKHSAPAVRPDSARYRLLQDLRHTNLSNLINSSAEDAIEINRRQAELESARKKEYQRELMQQIEEKRRTIKLLRDKEHQQEEVLTRRLQEQLKTMKLEEQLEKERIKAVKVRFDAEQNRLSREHLLAKLENDSQLLLNAELNAIQQNKKTPTHSQETNKENISHRNDNKVYKYFSNSEKHDYSYRNKSSALPTEIDLELDDTEMAKIERECFHLSEKICPMCDEPLKELENFCLRCQNKLSFRIKQPANSEEHENNTKSSCSQKNSDTNNDNEQNDKTCDKQDKDKERSFFLVCIRCERLYSWCKTCTTKTDVCKACQNKRNLCMSCRKTLCSFCLEEVACGKDSESLHINDKEASQEMSFHAMNDARESSKNDNKSSNISTISPEYSSLNNLDYINHPPYSINIEQNSIFHPDNKPYSLFTQNNTTNLKSPPIVSDEKNISFYDKDDDYLNLSQHDDDDKNIERLRRDTDKRLTRYLKNYGDLAYQTRGTQTTPTSSGRRDIVIQGEHSLSIPLMREMPKMTRQEAVKFKQHSKELENLQRRWDIPAVQKYTVSSVSPKVVTQVGAIKKQLQIERIFSDETDS